MNDIENLSSEFSELHDMTDHRTDLLEGLENKYEEKGVSFSDNNAKPIVAASALVNMRMPESKKGLEKSLEKGATLEKAMAENSSDLNVGVGKIGADELDSSDGVEKVVRGLENGDVFIYENKDGEVRMIYGAEVNTHSVDGEVKHKVDFKGYGGEGFVSNEDVRKDIKGIIADGGSILQISDAPSKMQELVKTYDGGRSM